MLIKFSELTIRHAEPRDAATLAAWWNDGRVMAHAGFPNGLGTTAEEISESLKKDVDGIYRRLIIELDGRPIGEMNYRKEGEGVAGIGIKICDFSQQEKGYGKIVLSLLISHLFGELGFEKIILDTNLANRRAQHVYEQLGFRQVRVNIDAWIDQLGQPQSFIDYELLPENFVNFAE